MVDHKKPKPGGMRLAGGYWITRAQKENLHEWLERMMAYQKNERPEFTYTEILQTFNELPYAWKAKILTKRWYRASDAEPIKRDLVPAKNKFKLPKRPSGGES